MLYLSKVHKISFDEYHPKLQILLNNNLVFFYQ